MVVDVVAGVARTRSGSSASTIPAASASAAAVSGAGRLLHQRRGDPEEPQAVLGEVGEHRRGDRAAVDVAGRLVDHHDDRQLGLLGRHEADEVGDVVVVAGGVLVAALGQRLAGGARLAGHRVAGDATARAGALGDHVHEHLAHLLGGGFGHHAPRLAGRRRVARRRRRRPSPARAAAARTRRRWRARCRPRASAWRSPRCPGRSGSSRSTCRSSPRGAAAGRPPRSGSRARSWCRSRSAAGRSRADPCPSIWASLIVPMFDDSVRMRVTE